ncbi:hypothetical protein DSBG_1323 [Desulfosporosinus sp. BG]|nr:hypothetical protein DSBG_1323 [Desulfosporosinus sp. BG]
MINPGGCVGSTCNVNYSSNTFKVGKVSNFNYMAHSMGLNPATVATIASLETESTGINTGCSSLDTPCDTLGAGICQVGKAMFDNWNASSNNIFIWCGDICGSKYINNLALCADFLLSAFKKLQNLGYNDQIQMMAMAGTAWNGNACGHSSNTFYPWTGGGAYGYYLPGSNQLTRYGSSAGAIFKSSGYVGTGVFDTSITL